MHFNQPWTRSVSQSHTATVPITTVVRAKLFVQSNFWLLGRFLFMHPLHNPYLHRYFCSHTLLFSICVFYVRIDWRTAKTTMHMRKRLQCHEKWKIEALEREKFRSIETNATGTTISDFVQLENCCRLWEKHTFQLISYDTLGFHGDRLIFDKNLHTGYIFACLPLPPNGQIYNSSYRARFCVLLWRWWVRRGNCKTSLNVRWCVAVQYTPFKCARADSPRSYKYKFQSDCSNNSAQFSLASRLDILQW